MLLLRTAYKNIIAGGKRTWLNVAVLSFVLVLMIGFNAIMDGWLDEARRDTCEWETGNGQYWHSAYDRYDIFTLQDAHGSLPSAIRQSISKGEATPILATQATIYSQRRMQNAILRGIDPAQQILRMPSAFLAPIEGDIPAIIGSRMARQAQLREGDRLMIRWRDSNNAFDACEILIVHIFDTKVPTADGGQIYIPLEDLRAMTGMADEATYVVTTSTHPVADTDEWAFHDTDFLLADIGLLEKAQRMEVIVIFIILLSIALLAVFDTQTLSIFRRQKEIGTYVALGMTPRGVSALFTLEGTMYSLLAVLAAAVWGTPLLILFARTGMPLPATFNDMGIPIGEVMYPAYKASSIAVIVAVVVVASALVSYLPARRIAR